MHNFFSLLKMQALSFMGLNKTLHGKKSRAFKGLAGVILLALLLCVAIAGFGYIYSDMFGQILLLQDRLIELPVIMIALSAFIGFMFSFAATGTMLYAFKDYEMLSAMPIKNREIVFSKLVFMYLGDLIFTLLIVAPAIYVYANLGGTITFGVIVKILVLAVFSPFLPMAISIVIGAGTSVIASMFRKKNLLQTIFLTLFFVGIFCVSFLAGEGMAEGADMTATIKNVYFIMPIALACFDKGINILWFILINFGSVALVSVLVCVTYKKFNTIISTKRTRKNFKLKGEYAQNGVFTALYKRETARLFSLPMFVVNNIFGVIFPVIAIVVLAILISTVPEIISIINMFAVYVPVVFAFSFMLSPMTASSISLEGGSFYLVKTMPIKMTSSFNAKLAVNFTYYGSAALISSLVIGIMLRLSVWNVILCVLIALSVAALGGNLGLFFNILFPKLKWENVNQPVKQSFSSFLAVTSAFIVTALFVLAAVYIPLGVTATFAIILGFTLICNAGLYIFIIKKGESILRKKT